MGTIRFESDYTEGAHPKIIEALVRSNEEQCPGYGVDRHCERARALIKDLCGNPRLGVEFLVGGTQANVTVIDAMLHSYQGVFCVETGHINVHETGAIELTGHKCLVVPGVDGKVPAEEVRKAYKAHWRSADHEHMVQPGMVYISSPAENGVVYTKSDLIALRRVCDECGLYLFMDGARMGYGLMSEGSDLTLADIAELCDVFYIGGTKVGALFGEAVVFKSVEMHRSFRYAIKQHGGMLAKGRLLGVQFETLFEDGLYFTIAKHAVDCAMKIRRAFEAKGIEFWNNSTTNQQFPILTNEQMEYFTNAGFSYAIWGEAEDGSGRTIVRFCTSWATKSENVDALIAAIEKM